MVLIQNFDKLYEEDSNIRKIVVNDRIVWPTKVIDYSEPFYVENIKTSNETLMIKKSGDAAPTVTIEYSYDAVNWSTLGTTSTTAMYLTVEPGKRIYLRSQTNVFGGSATNSINGCSKIGGNLMSLLYGSNFTNQHVLPSSDQDIFRSVFNIIDRTTYNDVLEDASKLILPDDTAVNCYTHLFRNNRSIIKAPVLPATVLSENCYGNMFNGCISLIKAPDLPATTLVRNCYQSMFESCTSLKYVKCLAETGINTNRSTTYWMRYASTTGIFYKKTGVTWPTGNNGILSGWTVIDV